MAALGAEGDTVATAQRARILSEHGVTEEDLLDFAGIHGDDVVFMREVWNEVEARLDAARERPDSLRL